MEKLFKYSDGIYGVIKYGPRTQVSPGKYEQHPASPISVGEEVALPSGMYKIVEILETRKSKGTFANESSRPYWAKVVLKR